MEGPAAEIIFTHFAASHSIKNWRYQVMPAMIQIYNSIWVFLIGIISIGLVFKSGLPRVKVCGKPSKIGH
jgi:hypothetical protein